MNLFIYSDESGVFDKNNNKYYIFGGIICLGSQEKEIWSRKYAKAEKIIRIKRRANDDYELKATNLTNNEKGKLFRSLNKCYKFGVIINEEKILDQIFKSKKDKQRYLDFAFKIAVKRAFEKMIKDSIIKATDIERLYFFVDEHTTATNGRYELKESLEQEFKTGTYNYKYDEYFPPIFSNLQEVNVSFCNSKNKLLVRAADIIANRLHYLAVSGNNKKLKNINNLNIIQLP